MFKIEENNFGRSSAEVDIFKMTRQDKHAFMRWMLDAMDKLTRKAV